MTDKSTPTDTPPPCDQELFDQGVSVGLFDIPKWTAEALCRGIAAATEARVDWHYIGGRVHIKALPAARAPAGAEESRTIPDREIPGIVEKALQELEGLVKYATSTYGHWDMRRAKGALSDLEWWARRKLAAHAQSAECVTAPAGVVGPDGMMRDELRGMIEGMSVSVDVSTGDHDAGHRYFGTVTEVMECQGNKHGATLLVQDAEPNFAPTPAPPADSVLEDAARYQWLRDQAHPDSEDSGIAVSESDFNDWGNKFTRYYSGEELDAAIDAARAADSVPAIQGEMNVQRDTDPNTAAPGQQRDVACSLALGQPVGNGSDQVAGHPSAQGDKLLTVAERNIRSFLRSATFKSESDREAALNCVDVLWAAARAPADSVQEDAADPLQCAANWLAEAHGQFSPVVLSGCLMIGYNRAKRLHDAALAASKQGEKQ